MSNADYVSKGIVLHRDTWAAFDRLREVHGSYNKALIQVLSAGGAFESAIVADYQSEANEKARRFIRQEPDSQPKSLKEVVNRMRPKGDKTR